MSMDLKTIFQQLAAGRDLSREQAHWVFDRILSGEMPEHATAALLGAILAKGEGVDELVGAAEAMRDSAINIRCDAECIDTCGTGGDGISTYNVSTTAALIAAAAGATVAKHGNRSITRACGSTEVLTHLGINVEADPPTVERCLAEVRIGYLNARNLHPAMRFAAPVRQAIPARTIFNLLGPLTNPAGARRQVLGVAGPDLLDKIAGALGRLGARRAWVVHGEGLCDLTVTGETKVVEVYDGSMRRFTLTPEALGLRRASLDQLRVDSPAASAAMVLSILEGKPGAARDHALMNAGAALVVAGLVKDLAAGIAKAAKAVDQGLAMETLTQCRRLAGLSDGGERKGRSA